MPVTFLVIALIIAVIDWIAIARGWRKVEYFAKPGVMIALLAWMWQIGGFQGRLAWFSTGLLLSMVGDILLMLPRERFIPGLVFFLLAHVAYLLGFNTAPPPLTVAGLILVILVVITSGQVGRRILAGLARAGQHKLKIPIIIYAAVISLMLISALVTLTRREWAILPAFLASGGALLFYLSDTFLAWNRFVDPLPYGRLRVMVSYHLGQALIVLGAALRFLFPI